MFYAGASTGMTTAWFALALICFWVEMQQLVALMERLGWSGVLLAFCMLTVAAGFVLSATQYCISRLEPVVSRTAAYFRGQTARNLALGVRVVMIAGVTSFFHKAPEFVYRAF